MRDPIPEAAVVAAEAAVIQAMIDHGPDGHIDGYEEIARAALEAALPHLNPLPSWLVQMEAARLRATLDERLGRGAPQTKEGDHE